MALLANHSKRRWPIAISLIVAIVPFVILFYGPVVFQVVGLLSLLFPMVSAILAIIYLKNTGYGLLIASALTIVAMAITNFCCEASGRWVPFEYAGLGELLVSKVDYSIVEMALMAGGLAILANGFAGSVAPTIIGWFRYPKLRLFATGLMSTAIGFASSVTATELAISVTPQRERSRKQNQALFAGISNIGSVLVPFSPSWIFYTSTFTYMLESGSKPEKIFARNILVNNHLLLWLIVLSYAVAMVIRLGIVHNEPAPIVKTKSVGGKQLIVWLLFIAPLFLPVFALAIPEVRNLEDLKLDHLCFYGLLCSIALYFLFHLIDDEVGGRQQSIVESESDDPLLAHARAQVFPVAETDYVYEPKAKRIVAFAIPADRMMREKLSAARLAASWQSRVGMFEKYVREGALVGFLGLMAGVFRTTYQSFIAGVNFHYYVPLYPAWWLLVIYVVGGIFLGFHIGTGWGTFAVLLAMTLPWLQTTGSLEQVALLGVLIAVTAAMNSCSPRSDNVEVVSHSTHESPDKISSSLLGFAFRRRVTATAQKTKVDQQNRTKGDIIQLSWGGMWPLLVPILFAMVVIIYSGGKR